MRMSLTYGSVVSVLYLVILHVSSYLTYCTFFFPVGVGGFDDGLER